MSTKKIREALAVVAAIKAPGGPMHEIHEKAVAEVEAIERAAKAYEEVENGGHSPDALEAAHSLMLRIAREAQ